jgi:phosphate-selective porin OprO/OprP
MKKTIILFFILSIGFFSIGQENSNYKVYWKNGTHIESDDGAFKFKFGGRIQYDIANFFEGDAIKDSIGTSKNGMEFRRVRFYNSGTIYTNIKYKLQFDFSGGTAKLNDAYIKITKIPIVGFLQMGHFKEPIGFEELSSSKYLTFMERSLTSEDEPSRNTGFMIGNDIIKKRLAFRLGIFKDGDSFGNNIGKQDKYNVTGRLFGTPFFKPEKNQVLHVGAAYSYRNPQDKLYSLGVRPESHLSQKYLKTGVFTDVDNTQFIQTELAFMNGAFSATGEFINGRIYRNDNPDFIYTAYYIMGSYFITGESKTYKKSGIFSRVTPKKNFGNGGAGAWEIGLRYSSMDLNKENVAAGRLNNISLALNWYLNPATRIMTNYIFVNMKDVDVSNIIQMRVQIEF